jgi:hypothetical protein
MIITNPKTEMDLKSSLVGRKDASTRLKTSLESRTARMMKLLKIEAPLSFLISIFVLCDLGYRESNLYIHSDPQKLPSIIRSIGYLIFFNLGSNILSLNIDFPIRLFAICHNLWVEYFTYRFRNTEGWDH